MPAPEVATAPPPLREALAGFDESPAAYLRLARQLAAVDPAAEGLRPVAVALLASFTIDLFGPYLAVEGARRGLHVRPSFAPFGQLEQQLLDPSSAVYAGAPDVIAIAGRLDDLAPPLADGFLALDEAGIERALDELAGRVERLVRAARDRSTARLVVWNFAPPRRLCAGLADAALARSQSAAIAELNRRIARAAAAVPDAHVFDVARVASEVGLARWEDARLTFLARAPLSSAAQQAAGKALARLCRALFVPPKKCLVLDLDNTLWGGVLGEDGIGGIAVGQDYPGSVFLDFQRQLLALRDRGVLLAIASKNNEADVVELFAQHRDLAVALDDFAARQIHWNDKAASLRAIAAELNIGTDALAFFDDNPVEREWVRAELPEVAVIEVPKDPIGYGAALESSGVFDALVVTAEDRARAAQYRGEAGRRSLEASAASPEAFLRALDMRVHIGEVDGATLPRVAQLCGKTNQFNLTTRRHGQADLERMIARGAIALWMRVEDRFGDSGLVGVAIGVPEGDAVRLDTFLLSCRVLGRQVERALLAALGRRARARGATALLGEFIPTKKNAPARGFLPAAGFAVDPADPQRYRLSLDVEPADPSRGAPPLFQVIEGPAS